MGSVVVRNKFDGSFVQFAKQKIGILRKADFGVTHSRSTVAVSRTEVTLTLNQRIAHREVLRQTNHSVVSGRVTVRMILT